MSDPIVTAFAEQFRRLKESGDRGLAQLRDEDFSFRLSEQQNSIAVIVRHMAGNMRLRWTSFLTTDGEKPDRNREREFVAEVVSRGQVMRTWEDGWTCVFAAMAALRDPDLTHTVTIRGEAMTAASAIARQMAHYGWHVGQILLIAKHLRGLHWKYVTIPPATQNPKPLAAEPVNIRVASEADLPTISKWSRDWWAEDIAVNYHADAVEELSPRLGDFFLVAERDDALTAFVVAQVRETNVLTNEIGHDAFPEEKQYLEIQDLYVRPEQRGRGVGTMLVEAVMARARERGVMRSMVYSGNRDYARTARFYEQCGFRMWHIFMRQ